MPWIVGGSITFPASGLAVNLLSTTSPTITAAHIACKAVRIAHDPGNTTNNIYYGISTLNALVSPKIGVLGWLPPPNTATSLSFEWITEFDSQNGLDLGTIYVQGTNGQILLWSYVTQ